MKYVVMKYLRISSEDIDLDGLDKYESNSIANQRALLDDFISKTPEFGNCEVLEAIDDGRTGTNFNRPGIQKLLDFAQRGKIHCIIVKDLSRFGRNYLEVGDYLEQIFPALRVRFISVNDMYDSTQYNGTTGGINIAFRNLIAEMYSQDLSEKVRSAKNTINKSGKTSAPYAFFGYKTDPNDRHRLVIDEPAAEIVRLIFTLREQGMTTPKITKKLNENGIPTANGYKRLNGVKRSWLRNSKVDIWQTASITNMLRDERYTGKHIYGKMRRIELGNRTVKAVPQSEWIVVPDAFPAIITAEQFARVREISKQNIKTKAINKPNAPVSTNLLFCRKIFCGVCGKSLTRQKNKNGYVYYCSTKEVMDGLDCMRGNIKENTVMETVLAVLKIHAQYADDIKALNGANIKSSLSTITDLRGETQNLQKLIEKSNATKLALWEKQHTEIISKETFQVESEKLTEQITAYTKKIAEIEIQIHRLEMESGQENIFVERFSKQVCITELSRKIVDEFIQAIYIYTPERIEVVLNYADEFESIKMQMES